MHLTDMVSNYAHYLLKWTLAKYLQEEKSRPTRLDSAGHSHEEDSRHSSPDTGECVVGWI